MRIHVAIAVGLLAGLLFGLLAAVTGSPPLLHAAEAVAPLGTVFVNLLKMIVIPLVASTLFVGIAGMGDLRRLGRLGAYALGFFAITTIVAVLIGMGTMQLLLPLASESARAAAATRSTTPAPTLPGPVQFLIGLIPANPFRAASDGALLPLIVFTALFAAAAGTLPTEQRDRLMNIARPVTAALIRLVDWVLWVAPVGVFALAAPVTARSGPALLESLGIFIVAVIVGLIVFVAGLYLPAVGALGRFPTLRFLRAALAAQIIAFTTTSSATAIPALLEGADELALSPAVSSFVVPLGASLNRAGSALFQGAAVVFLAWLYGVSLSAAGLGSAVFATALVSITVASIPSASVLTLAPALGTVGIPLDGMAVLLGVDRIPDMFRTATNVTGDLVACAVIDRLTQHQAE